MQNILSELLETIGCYPEKIPDLHPVSEFQMDSYILKIWISVSASILESNLVYVCTLKHKDLSKCKING